MSACLRTVWGWCKKEAVLCISGICALFSMCLVPPSSAYLEYIDVRVLCLLFCLMVVVAGFQECGLFAVLAQKLLAGKKKIRFLFLVLVLLPFFTSMLVTNDVSLITFVPFSILILGLTGHSRYLIRIVVLQTIAANLGSMATPVGNPQNLFLYTAYSIPIADFFGAILPLALISLVILSAAALAVKQETVEVHFFQAETIQSPKKMALFSLLFLLCLLSVFRLLPYGVLLAVVLLALLVFDRGLFRKADYGLLLTFVFFFIFAGNIGQMTEVRNFLSGIMQTDAFLTSVCTSQVISNVPAAVLLSGFTEDWKGLLLGANIGGLGTPIASLASLISLKIYLRSGQARPLRYILFFFAGNILLLVLLSFFSMLLI